MRNFQIAIIGGGVVGCSIAREFSKYDVSVVLFEMGSDVACGASKANSGVIHSGINSPPSSLKANLCVEGNRMFDSLSKELSFSLKWTGKFVVAKNEDEIDEIERLMKIGIKNGVKNLEIKDGKEVKKIEPNISCKSALWVPTAGIVSPYEFTIALAENAVENGVTFLIETEVKGIKKKDDFLIKTNRGEFKADIVINASGLNCRKIVSMVEEPDFEIYPCRGEYLVLDKNYRNLINSMIYPVPVKEMGVLGVHLTPTIEGNILIGPSAEFIEDYSDTSTTAKMMKKLMEEARDILPSLPEKGVINAYSGIRCKIASPDEGGWADFRIEESKNCKNMINLIGIESPGLTASPAIAKKIVEMVSKIIDLKKKKEFKPRKRRKRFYEMSKEEKSAMIEKDKRWGKVICRCEHVTEAEVIEALSNVIGAKTLSAVKYRCRAGMGRCQGGFCTQHIVRIMEKYFGMKIEDIKLKSPYSHMFFGKTREK